MHHGTISPAIAAGLKRLRARLVDARIPSSKLDETINLATWNIREFGAGPRTEASLHYIAEILGQFDLVSVVELRDNLQQLRTVLEYLGPYWDVVYSDYSADPGGNHERLAFIHDTRAVTFTGLASHVVASDRTKNAKQDYVSDIDWWRPPYLAGFQAGSFDFILVVAHIRWGGDGNPGEEARARELTKLAKWVGAKAKEKYVTDKDLVILGDFNIPTVTGPAFKAITSTGLQIPKALRGVTGSNLAKDKRYDQLLHLPSKVFEEAFTGKGGVLDFAGPAGVQGLKDLYQGIKGTSSKGLTYELSDHLPLWIHVNTDHADAVLDQVLSRGRKGKKV
ncbi:endonuclease/exonuclease/phosphatase family protein [Geothrix terrae]|uniref:endonuclease/exonuclease/phosphatase family protein n=1 Tax=Geothrix terrae TaxID=2922720 RepID=UPI001FACC2EE|nr:endonuclease/exonuclease/phosphatase family protein [Geothrix terrae]